MIINLKSENYIHKLKVFVVIILLILSILLNILFQVILNVDIIYSHFFYLPIAFACFWWKKRGLIVSVILAGSLIFFPYFNKLDILSLQNIDNLLRALLLIVSGIIFSILSEYIAKTEKLSETNKNVNFYKDLLTHDMNTIIQNILSSTELYLIYRKNGKNIRELDELMSIIRDQGFRGKNLISNAQKLVSLEESDIFIENLNVIEILHETITFIQKSFQEKKIIISIDSPNQTIWVKANRLLLDLFEIILINATKYNENPIVEINIRISKELNCDINYFKIEFIDNGIGISDDRKSSIFQKRDKIDKYSRGMGFGLSLVKILIDKYRGKIWVEDRVPGDYTQGSNFIILIPEAIN